MTRGFFLKNIYLSLLKRTRFSYQQNIFEHMNEKQCGFDKLFPVNGTKFPGEGG